MKPHHDQGARAVRRAQEKAVRNERGKAQAWHAAKVAAAARKELELRRRTGRLSDRRLVDILARAIPTVVGPEDPTQVTGDPALD